MNNLQADILHLTNDLEKHLNFLKGITGDMKTEALVNEEPDIHEDINTFKTAVDNMMWRLKIYSN